jgi:hypothetical protein
MSNKKTSRHVARSQQEQALAVKTDKSTARTAKDLAGTNAPTPRGQLAQGSKPFHFVPHFRALSVPCLNDNNATSVKM